MILYHGSNTDIKVIDLAMCRPYKDFGRGFYLTVMKDQAEKMAKRVARIYGGSPILNVFEIYDSCIDSSDLSIKDFGVKTSEEWARFVMNNRNRKYDDFSNPECNFDNKLYDESKMKSMKYKMTVYNEFLKEYEYRKKHCGVRENIQKRQRDMGR